MKTRKRKKRKTKKAKKGGNENRYKTPRTCRKASRKIKQGVGRSMRFLRRFDKRLREDIVCKLHLNSLDRYLPNGRSKDCPTYNEKKRLETIQRELKEANMYKPHILNPATMYRLMKDRQ